jgi:predicted dehydrogenase
LANGQFEVSHEAFLLMSWVGGNLLSLWTSDLQGLATLDIQLDLEVCQVEDFGVASVRLDNGALMIFKTAWIMHMDSLGGTIFLGTKAGLRLDPLTIYRNEWGMLTDTLPQVPRVDDIELFKSENLAFADAIREGKPSPIPADEMLLTNLIIQGLIDSAAAGREVEVSLVG